MATSFKKKANSKLSQPRGTRPSLHYAQALISTGVPSLDVLLGGCCLERPGARCISFINVRHYRRRSPSWLSYACGYVITLWATLQSKRHLRLSLDANCNHRKYASFFFPSWFRGRYVRPVLTHASQVFPCGGSHVRPFFVCGQCIRGTFRHSEGERTCYYH